MTCRMSFEDLDAVGLDVEWKPELLSGLSNPASLLQVCFSTPLLVQW